MRAAGAAIVLLCAIGAPHPASAQPAYSPLRTPDGKVDLGGFWTNRSELSVERPDGATELVATPNPDGGGPFGQTVKGELRTSFVVDPPDGKLPFRDRAASQAWLQKYGAYLYTGKDADFTAGPETLPLRDRCLIAGNAAGPPMFRSGYNDAYLIVQTATHILIDVEMSHEARIVPLFKNAAAAANEHRPPILRRWTGDSVGWWEGDTLVIETKDINALQGQQNTMPVSAEATVIERFTRVSDGELFYEVDVTDLAYYTRPWKGESSFRTASNILEYACHEGNYGMPGILSGARKVERDKGQ